MRTRSVPNGNGYNEISLVDTAGKELLLMHGHKDMRVEVGNDAIHEIGNDLRQKVRQDASYRVGRNHSVEVTTDETLKVGGDRSLSVTGKHEERVDGNRTLTSKGEIKIQALQKIELSCGAGKIVIEPSGRIAIQGTMIELAGSGVLKINGALVQINC